MATSVYTSSRAARPSTYATPFHYDAPPPTFPSLSHHTSHGSSSPPGPTTTLPLALPHPSPPHLQLEARSLFLREPDFLPAPRRDSGNQRPVSCQHPPCQIAGGAPWLHGREMRAQLRSWARLRALVHVVCKSLESASANKLPACASACMRGAGEGRRDVLRWVAAGSGRGQGLRLQGRAWFSRKTLKETYYSTKRDLVYHAKRLAYHAKDVDVVVKGGH